MRLSGGSCEGGSRRESADIYACTCPPSTCPLCLPPPPPRNERSKNGNRLRTPFSNPRPAATPPPHDRSKNGNKLRTAFSNVRGAGGALIPAVGLHSRGEAVAVNFGARPFRFDLEGMVAEEAAAQQAAIRG